jgi:hypothetical protein
MNKKVSILIVICLFSSVLLFGQNKVMLTNGTIYNSSSIDINKETVQLNIEGESKSVDKNEILYIIPEGKAGYTIWAKNNKKMKINKKDIYFDYEGTDIARIFCYKYYQTPYDIDQLYSLNPNNKLLKEDFANVFNEQQKTLKKRGTVGWIVSGVVLLIGLGAFVGAMNDLNSISYNNLDMPDNLDLNVTYLDTEYYLALKNCS